MKHMTKRSIKNTSLLIIVFVLLSSTFAYAKDFTDVPGDNNRWAWAQEYIEKMNRAKIITGFPNDTFRPGDNVTRVQALVMMGRMYDLEDWEVEIIKVRYKDTLDEVKVQPWYRNGIAIAIENNIINEESLKEMYKKGLSDKPATKEEICIYLTRAMGLEEVATSNSVSVIPSFDDYKMIDTKAIPYINEMIKRSVINKKGDGKGNLNPKSAVNRAIMAKMLSIAYDYILGNDVTVKSEENLVTIKGSIFSLMKTTGDLYITVEDDNYNKIAYVIDENSIIIIDGETKTMDDVEEGLKIEAKVTEDLKVRRLTAESEFGFYQGKIESLLLSNPAIMTIEYDKDDDLIEETFTVSNDVSIELNNEKAYIYNLNEEDLVEVEVKNNRIVDIKAESKNKKLSGILKEIKYNPEPTLIVETKDGIVNHLTVGKKVDIERNEDDAKLGDLRVGDEIDLKLEYNIITDINANVIKSEDEGSIESILISRRPKLTILNQDQEEKTYYISNDASIEVDNSNSDIYDLKLGYFVEVKIEGNEIIAIDAEVKEQNNKYTGKVEYVNSKAEVFVVTVKNPVTGDEESIPMYVTEDTAYTYANGNSTSFRSIDKGDEVFVLGYYDGVIFIVNSVIITENNN